VKRDLGSLTSILLSLRRGLALSRAPGRRESYVEPTTCRGGDFRQRGHCVPLVVAALHSGDSRLLGADAISQGGLRQTRAFTKRGDLIGDLKACQLTLT
jgi:hypothetical protein